MTTMTIQNRLANAGNAVFHSSDTLHYNFPETQKPAITRVFVFSAVLMLIN